MSAQKCSFVISVSDGGLTTVRPFTVTVLSINDRPSISSVSSREIPPDTATIIPFTIFDVETPADALALQAVSSNPQVIDANGLRLGGSGTNRTLQLTPLSIRSGTSTVVTITVTDSSNEVTRMSFTITVPQPPIITSPPANQTVTNGATATFNVTATGPAPILYQWKRNGADLAGRTNSSLVLTGVRPTDSGSYTVVVRNSGGSVTSAAATLRVLVVPAITGISRAGATAGISFLSESGLSYTVEYRNSLAVPGWTSLTPVIGTGVRLTVTDPAATAPARFYRVRVQ